MYRTKATSWSCNPYLGPEVNMDTSPCTMERVGCLTSSNLDSGPAQDTVRLSPATRFIAAIISLAASWAFNVRDVAAECFSGDSAPSFHRPGHAAELSLDRLIHKENTDDNMFLFEVKRPDRNLRKDQKYKGLFTSDLEKAWADTETELVQRDCGGKYLDNGEICGMNFSPLSCAQDYSEKGYLYRLDCADDSTATITMRWPLIAQPVATYHMIRRGKGWVVDGVACLPTGPAFNMGKSPKP